MSGMQFTAAQLAQVNKAAELVPPHHLAAFKRHALAQLEAAPPASEIEFVHTLRVALSHYGVGVGRQYFRGATNSLVFGTSGS